MKYRTVIGIYKITNPDGMVYIGQSNDINRRFEQYKKHLPKNQPKLFDSFSKHGIKEHYFDVLEETSVEFLSELELKYQKEFDCVDNGLNCVYVKLPKKKYTIEEKLNGDITFKDQLSIYNSLGILMKYIDMNNDRILIYVYLKECLLKNSEVIEMCKIAFEFLKIRVTVKVYELQEQLT